jgi:hypothetical protein
VTALELEEVAPDVSIAELEKQWGISRNALKSRARALGVELIRQGPTLTVWPGDRVAEAHRLDAHLKAGGAMASFPGVAAAGTASTDSQLSVTPHGRSVGSQLAPTAAKADQLAALAAALAASVPSLSADPLQRARGLAEAADAGLVLANEDMAALLGHGVTSWRNGHQAYGYVFQRHQQGRQVLWTVARALGRPSVTDGIGVSAVTPASAHHSQSRRPGFVVDAHATVLSRLELPAWVSSGSVAPSLY